MILVIGGTGTVGSELVRDLLARSQHVKVLTRSQEKVKEMPAGVEGVVGDLLEPDTIRTVFRGVRAVYMTNASSPSEAHEGLHAVEGARKAGVGRFVYQSVFGAEEPYIPIIAAKTIIESALRTSRIPHVILRPNNFFQNDYWYQEALLRFSVYPQPLGNVGVSRVDVRDIAEAAAIALTNPAYDGLTCNLVGPQSLTTQDVATMWGSALGKPIGCGADNLDEWEASVRQFMPALTAYDLRLLFDIFHERGFKGSESDIKRQRDLLGREPRDFQSFARDTASAWSTPRAREEARA